MKNTALIAAAGSGNRMQSKVKKQYLKVAGQLMLARTVLFFENNPQTHELVLVLPERDISYCQEEIIKPLKLQKPVRLVCGGTNRAQSVLNGLRAIEYKSSSDIVMIHDGARPLLSDSLVERLIGFLRENPGEIGVIPVVPVKDTIKVVEQNIVSKTYPRDSLFAAQTPQCFKVTAILDMFDQIEDKLEQFTDESSIGEYLGYKIHTVIGEENNIKITTPLDIAIAEFLIGGE